MAGLEITQMLFHICANEELAVYLKRETVTHKNANKTAWNSVLVRSREGGESL